MSHSAIGPIRMWYKVVIQGLLDFSMSAGTYDTGSRSALHCHLQYKFSLILESFSLEFERLSIKEMGVLVPSFLIVLYTVVHKQIFYLPGSSKLALSCQQEMWNVLYK